MLFVETLKWNRLTTEGEPPNFRRQPSSYFEPLWMCIDLPNEEMIYYSPYNQYEAMSVECGDNAVPDADGQNIMILNPGKLGTLL